LSLLRNPRSESVECGINRSALVAVSCFSRVGALAP
jgi:hypothetical protein